MKKHIIIFLFAIMLLTIFCGCGLGGNAVSESIRPDSTPPVVSITSPDNGNTYGSGTIVIQGKAADDLKIIKVEISIDGGSYTESNKQGFSSNSLELDWIDYVDTSTLSNGLHTITARATDLWDNTNTVSIDIIVDNGAPLAVISGVPPLLSDTDYLNAAVSGEGIVAYKYKLDIADWSPEISVEVPVSASGLGVGEHTLLIIGKKIVDGKEVWQDATEEVTKYVWSVNTQYYFSASDGAGGDVFGVSVAVSSDGSTIVAGASEDDGSGSVYVYNWTGNVWNQAKLKATDGTAADRFGQSVAISSDGSTVVVGATADDDNGNYSGSAYVYSWTGNAWNQTKIIATDGAADDTFGWSVAVSSDGSTVVVSAPGDDDNGDSSGSAYVYSRTGSTWNQTKIMATDGAASDYFGWSVAVSSDGSTIIVGAYCDDDNGSTSGSAYVYSWTGSTWYQTKIIATDGAADDAFGRSVAVSSGGSTVIIGAHGDDDNGNLSGSAYVYNWTGSSWNQTKIISSDGAVGDLFGWSVAVSSDGSTIIVGAYGDGDNGNYSGSAYVYNWTGSDWDQTKIIATDGAAGDYFGYSVAVSSDGNTIIVGSYCDNNEQGSVHLFYQ